jgi:hypothetical protein
MVNLSWVLASLVIAFFSITITALLLWFVRKKVPHESLKKHHDVAGFILGIVGILYSVVLGFTVVNAKDRYNQAENTIHIEATMLADLYRDSTFFPDENRLAIRASLRNYVNYVLEDEWFNQKDHLSAQKAILNLWNSYREIDLSSELVKIWYSQSVAKIDSLMNARLERQFFMHEHLGCMMWTLLIVGAIITVSFLFFFGIESLMHHLLMTSLLVGYLSFMLYLVYSLDHPFTGAQAIEPTALEQNLIFFDELDQNQK